jgi:protein NrfD
LAGAAQVIATIADLFGDGDDVTTVRAGRYLALAGAILSPVLLVLDLQTRSRWLNMLRVVRLTSPMSIGAWVLAAFGATSGLAALGTLLDHAFGVRSGRAVARTAGLPAAAAGAVMSYYTGALLGATSTPLWAAGYRTLPPLFAASSMATASASLSLVAAASDAPRSALRRLRRLALIASGVELLLSLVTNRTWEREGVGAPLRRRGLALLGRLSVAGMLLPLAIHTLQELTERESRVLVSAASLLTLVGGYCLRALIVLAGNASVEDPTIYLTRQTEVRVE